MRGLRGRRGRPGAPPCDGRRSARSDAAGRGGRPLAGIPAESASGPGRPDRLRAPSSSDRPARSASGPLAGLRRAARHPRRGIRHALAAALLALPPLAALAPAALAQDTLVSNLAQAGNIDSVAELATAFTTGSSDGGYTLSAVDLRVIIRGRDPVVTIRAGGDANPGALVATLASPSTLTANAVNTFTAPAGTVLAASTTYFLVVNDGQRGSSTTNSSLSLADATAQTGAAGWSIADGSRFRQQTETWFASTSPLAFALKGAPNRPAKPAGLTAAPGPNSGQVTLRWTNPGDSRVTSWQYDSWRGTPGAWGGWRNFSPGAGPGATEARISGLANGTQYGFRVRARAGSLRGAASDAATATPAANPPPLKPTGLTATPGDGRITLSWDNPGDARITHWQVRVRTRGGAWSPWGAGLAAGSVPGFSFTVTGRTNGTAYDYQIRATVGEPTADGTLFGPASDTVSATPRKPPPAKPTGLTATPTNGGVTLSWTSPNNADITRWQFRSRTGGGNWGSWAVLALSGDATSGTVSGLVNGTSYDFQIRAVTETSEGAASDAVSATPMAPTPTVEFVFAEFSQGEGEGTATSSVVRIANPGASFVLGYAVTGTATRGTDFTVPASVTVDAGVASALIPLVVIQDALREADETVIITLADGDGYDLGGRTTFTLTIFDDDPPSAPAGLAAAAGDGQVVLSWTDPSDAAISRYEFRRRAPAGTGTWGSWTEIVGSAAATTDHTVTGLANGTEYGFQVRATDGRLLGAASSEATATPTAAAPAAPTGFTATAGPGGGEVTLRWTRPSGTVTDYQYRVRRPGGGWFGWANMSGGAGITSFTGSFTEVLDFQMRARNGSVGGTPSAIARATPVAAPAAPAGLTATAGNARVTLGWTNPNNGDITKWQYRQRTGGGGFGSWTDIAGSNADTTAHTVTGLTNGTAYGFQVRAAAAPGGTVPGAASAAVSATPALPGVGLVLDPTSLKVAEGGSAAYTVALATKPTGSVTVTVAGAGGEVTADADAVQGGDQSTLTFTTVNWATPRTVTVSAGHDLDGVNDSATLTHTAAGGGYGSATGSVAVTVVDDDAAFLVANDPDGGTATGGVNDEFATAFTTGGNAAGYAVSSVSARLFARSGRPLSVAIREDGAGGRPGALAARLSNPPSPADDAANVFTAPDGTVLKAGATYWLVANDGRRTDTNARNAFFAVTASDAYGGAAGWSIAPNSRRTEESQMTLFAEASSLVLMFGIEAEAVTAALAFSRDAVTVVEEADAAYTVALAGRPTGSVTVTIASDNGDVTVDTDATAPGSQNTLTFTTSDWSAPKTVTVSAADDGDAANDAATLTHTASGGNYASVTGSVAVTVTDNDAPGLALDPTALTVAEGGSGAYTVKLATQPTGTVTVTVAGASGEVTFDTDSTANGNQSTLTFNTTNWGTARTVTVSAGQDNDGVDDSATLTHSASGGGYGSVTGSVAVTVADDDAAPAAPAGLAAAGGHRQVVLSWTDPGDGAIDGWQFRQRTPPVTGAWGSWTNIADSTATTAAHTVTGLTNGTAYGFQVRAVDGALEGAASSEATATPAAVTFGLTPLEASVRVPLPEGTTVPAFNWFLNRRLNDADPATVGFPITLGGSAMRGSDYTLSCASPASDQMDSACSGMDSGTPTITLDRARLGSRSRGSVYLMVNVAADGAVEAEETLTMATSGTSLTFRIVEAPASVTVGFTRERYTHSETNGPITFVLRSDAPTGRDLRFPLSFSGTATRGTDYEAPDDFFVFKANGSATQEITYLYSGDGIDEPNETVAIALGAAPQGAALGAIASATMFSKDVDPTEVTLSGAAGDVAEGGSKAFTVALGRALAANDPLDPDFQVGEALAVPLAFEGTATRGADYTVSCPTTLPTGVACNDLNTDATPTVTFTGPSAASVTLTLTAAADGGGTVDVGLGELGRSSGTGLAGGATGTDRLAEFRIADDGEPPPPPTQPPSSGGGSSGGGGGGGGGGGQRPEAPEALEARSVPSGGALALDLSAAFRSPGGGALSFTATSSEPAVASVSVEGAVLTARGLLPGVAEIAVTATDGAGRSISQRFALTVTAPEAAWHLPPAADPFLQGFVRVVNHSAAAGEVAVTAVDDAGREHAPLTLRLGPHAVAHFNSDDLEAGNAAKGLSGGAGPGAGGWRLAFGGGSLDAEAIGLLRTADGFVTAMAATAPRDADGALRLLTFNPAGNTNQASRLRLVNPTDAEARATVTGTDDAGASPGSPVVLTLPAGSACEVGAAALESGRGLACGAPQAGLGDGAGKWRLSIASEAPLVAMGLLSSPGGHLTNLSAALPEGAGGVRRVPLFPSASDPYGRQGFVRVANRSGRAGTVAVRAFDDGGRVRERLSLRLGARQARQFNSDDLELGAPAKGLSGRTGSGTGAWRLELSSADIDFEAGAYARHADGFLTAMQAAAPSRDGAHRVATFNPGSNANQASRLRLVNWGPRAASATVTGADDRGARPGGAVEVSVPAGSAVELTAAQLESGEAAAIASGALGDGAGKWRLRVASDADLSVMSLVSSPMGRLANWSGADESRGAPPLPSLPAPPAWVRLEDAGGRRVRGEWDAAPGMRYGVELLLDGAPLEGRSLARTARTSFRWSGLAPGAYALRARSVDADGKAGPWSPPTDEVVID